MAPLKQKGDLAELKIAADLAERGCSISPCLRLATVNERGFATLLTTETHG